MLQKPSVFVIGFILFCASFSWGQDEIPTKVNSQNRTGPLPFSTTVGSDLEHVDVATGNLVVNIPFASKRGRGLDFEFGLRYNALFWTAAHRVGVGGIDRVDWTIESRNPSAVALGWEDPVASFSSVTRSFPCAGGAYYESNFIYHDTQGGKHPVAVQDALDNNCPIHDTQGPDLTGEGMSVSTTATTFPTLRLADGTFYDDANGESRDSNGNKKTTWTDTLGHAVVTVENTGSQRIYRLFDSDGTQRSFTVNFIMINLATAFNALPYAQCGYGIFEFTGSRQALDSIELPNGTKYQFHYENGSYGALTGIDLPTGGSITYTWATKQDGPKSRRRVATRTVTVGGASQTWTFNGTTDGMTVIDPANNYSVYTTTTDDVVTHAKFYQGSDTTGTLLRHYQVDYTSDSDPWIDGFPYSFCPQEAQPVGIRPVRITTFLDDGKQSKIEYDYELFTYTYHPNHNADYWASSTTFTTSRGNVTEIREFGYGQGTPGPLVRKTVRTYLHGGNANYTTLNIVDRVLSETVYDGAGVQRARTEYEYDTTGVASSTGAPQHDDMNYSASFSYRGNPTRIKHWRNTDGALLTTTYVYDSLGNIQSITNPRGFATTYSYSDRWANTSCVPSGDSRAYLTGITNAVGQRIQFSYYPCTGLKQARSDENDILNNRAGTTFLYDLLGRIKQTDYPDGGQTVVSYNDVVPVTITTTTKINGSLSLVNQSEFDGLGRSRLTRLLSDPQGTVYTRTAYDAIGRVSQIWNPTRCNPDNVGSCVEATYGITQTQYDALGRVTTLTSPDSATMTTVYSGNTSTVTDPAGHARRSSSDALGRLIQVTEDPTVAAYVTTYAYDVLNNLTSVAQGVQTRTFVYDSLSQLRSATNPESATIQYTYDPNGNLQSRQDARGTLTTYSYDNLDRLTSKIYTIGSATAATPNVTYTYDTLPAPCNSQGRLVSVTSSVSSTSAGCFDARGRPLQSSQTTGGNTYAFSYAYDLAGNLTSETYPSGRVMVSVFDGAGRVANVRQQGAGFYAGNAVNPIQYAPHGAARQIKLGNGLWEESRYNVRLQPVQIGLGAAATDLGSSLNTSNSSSLLLEYGYGTANNGNLVSQTIRIGSTALSQSYAYDALNRLAAAAETNGWSHNYVIDPYGNQKRSDLPYTFDSNTNQISIGSGYNYDPVGNLVVNNTQQTFTYDAENRQASFNTGTASLNATYDYDGDGRRVRKIQGGATTTFVYDTANRLAAEYSTVPQQTGTSYLTADHLGSTRVVTDGSGAAFARHDYYPFGEEIPASTNGRSSIAGYSATDTIRQKFTGKERDAETNLDFFGARYFSGAQGRFTGPDFVGPDISNPQTLNKYQYALNNPLRYVDRNGLYEEDVHRDLTNVLALAAGLSSTIAARIAGADQGADDNPQTSPMRVFGGEEARRLYHFTTDERRRELYSAFETSGGPEDLGMFLHAEQDSFSHAGFGPSTGHLSAGHTPDKTYTDPAKADLMARETYDRLLGATSRLSGTAYKPLDWKTLSPLVQAFNRARTTKEKQQALQLIRDLVHQNIEQQKQREAERRRTGFCSAEFSNCQER